MPLKLSVNGDRARNLIPYFILFFFTHTHTHTHTHIYIYIYKRDVSSSVAKGALLRALSAKVSRDLGLVPLTPREALASLRRTLGGT